MDFRDRIAWRDEARKTLARRRLLDLMTVSAAFGGGDFGKQFVDQLLEEMEDKPLMTAEERKEAEQAEHMANLHALKGAVPKRKRKQGGG
jgi:hypothetical protein